MTIAGRPTPRLHLDTARIEAARPFRVIGRIDARRHHEAVGARISSLFATVAPAVYDARDVRAQPERGAHPD